MRTIRLLPRDIPRYWEHIKYTCKATEEIDEQQFPAYATELLQALLNEKAQAWIRVTDENEIALIHVTRILHNPQFDEDYLYLQSTFAWKRLPEDMWNEEWELMKAFARKEGCSYIGAMSRNPRIWEMAKKVGFFESTRIFAYRL